MLSLSQFTVPVGMLNTDVWSRKAAVGIVEKTASWPASGPPGCTHVAIMPGGRLSRPLFGTLSRPLRRWFVATRRYDAPSCPFVQTANNRLPALHVQSVHRSCLWASQQAVSASSNTPGHPSKGWHGVHAALLADVIVGARSTIH